VLDAITGHQGMRHGHLPAFLSFWRQYSTSEPGLRGRPIAAVHGRLQDG